MPQDTRLATSGGLLGLQRVQHNVENRPCFGCMWWHNKSFRLRVYFYTQMPATLFGSRGDDIAHFHLRIVDDDAIHEQFDQLSALDKRSVVQSRLGAPAKRLDALSQAGNINVLLGLGIELA